MAFGSGKEFHFIPAHEICASLDPRRSTALPIFHAFTGCDTVSHFARIGRNTASKVERPTKNLLMLSMACIMFQRKSLKRLNHP